MGIACCSHAVHKPDLFEGRTSDTVEEGVGYAKAIGSGEVMELGIRSVDGLPAELVYGGYSRGVLPTQRLAQTPAVARFYPPFAWTKMRASI